MRFICDCAARERPNGGQAPSFRPASLLDPAGNRRDDRSGRRLPKPAPDRSASASTEGFSHQPAPRSPRTANQEQQTNQSNSGQQGKTCRKSAPGTAKEAILAAKPARASICLPRRALAPAERYPPSFPLLPATTCVRPLRAANRHRAELTIELPPVDMRTCAGPRQREPLSIVPRLSMRRARPDRPGGARRTRSHVSQQDAYRCHPPGGDTRCSPPQWSRRGVRF